MCDAHKHTGSETGDSITSMNTHDTPAISEKTPSNTVMQFMNWVKEGVASMLK